MVITLQRALVAMLALGLVGVSLSTAPAGAAVGCATPGVPVIEQFSMNPAGITAPSVGEVEHTTLSAQVDQCGGERLLVRVEVTAPDDQTREVADFGQSPALDGSFSTDMSWQSGDIGTWHFTLRAQVTDVDGGVQDASATVPFTVVAPAPAPVPVAPGAPRSVTVVSVAATTGVISWEAPTLDGGSDIIGYRISEPTRHMLLGAAARTYTLRGLEPAQSYPIRVEAQNAQGYGPTSTVTLKTPSSVPAHPRALKVSRRTVTSGKVSWTAPASDGGMTVTGYRIARPGPDVTVKPTARSYTVKGLKPGRTYVVKVKAKNAKGYGLSSRTEFTTLVTVPTKPRSPKVSKRTSTSGKVSWKTPSSNGGVAITGYRIVKPGADITLKGTARSYTVKGLKPGRSYTVKVKAKNSEGYGPSVRVTLKTTAAARRNCTAGYSPCLPPASDYDCAGGSGNGPAYAVGPIWVTGSDPYDLDADGDGIACE